MFNNIEFFQLWRRKIYIFNGKITLKLILGQLRLNTIYQSKRKRKKKVKYTK